MRKEKLVAVAQPDWDRIFERLVAIEGAAPSEFWLRRIADDASKLMREDPLRARTVLGAVAAQRRDVEEVHLHHGWVVYEDPSAINWYNYATSLALSENDEQALRVAADALVHHADRGLLDLAIGSSQRLGEFTRALEYCEKWRQITGQEHDRAGYARELCNAMGRGLFTEDGARRLVSLGHEVQLESGIRRTRLTELLSDDASYLYCWDVYADAEQAATLNESLADRVATDEALIADPGIALAIMFVGQEDDLPAEQG